MGKISEWEHEIDYINFAVGYFDDRVAVFDWPEHPEQVVSSSSRAGYAPSWQRLQGLLEEIEASLGLLPNRQLTPQEERALTARYGRPCWDEMRALGKELRKLLFPQPIWDEFYRAVDEANQRGKRLRLRLYFDRRASNYAHLVHLPWELLYIEEWDRTTASSGPELFPFLIWNPSISLVHQLELEPEETQHTGAMPLRLLLVMSEPKEGYWARFPLDRLEDEYTSLCNGLRSLEQQGLVEIETLRDPTPAQLEGRLAEGFHVMHYFGHAYFQEGDQRIPREDDLTPALWQQVQGGGGLVLVGDNQKAAYLPAEELARWVAAAADAEPGTKKARLRVVVLNACKTARDDPRAAPHGGAQRRGVAYRLLEAGVPAVVAMRYPVPDVSGPLFAEEFYRGLANWLPIDACVSNARAALSRPPRHKYPDWSLPVVYLRSESGRLFASWEEIWREQYLQFVRDRYCYMKSIDPDRELTIKDYYVPLQLGERIREEPRKLGPDGTLGAPPEEERIYEGFQAWREQAGFREPGALRPLKVDQALKRSPIVILGDPGSGKSTAAQYIAVQSASEAQLNRRVPIFIKLPDWWMHSGYDPIRYAATLYVAGRIPKDESELSPDTKRRRNNFEEALRGWTNAGECIWLFDGLDEVTQNRDELIERLQDLAQGLLRRCTIVVTSRIAGYDENRLRAFHHFEIMPLTLRQADRLIDLWFQTEVEKAEALKRALKANPQMRVLATNPLLLTMICFVFERNQLRLPMQRGELYERAVRELLEFRGRAAIPEEYPPEHKRFILEEVALHFFKRGKEIFDDHELLAQIETLAKRKGYKRPRDGSYIREDLVRNSGLLFEGTDGRYLFLHLTFQEYLTACALARRKELADLDGKQVPQWLKIVKPHFFDPRWEEVIRLLASKLEDATPLIEAIWQEPEDLFLGRLLLAGKCLVDARRLQGWLRMEIIEQVLALMRRAIQRSSQSPTDELISLELQRANLERLIGTIAAVYDEVFQEVVSMLGLLLKSGSNELPSLVCVLGHTKKEAALKPLIALVRNHNPSIREVVAQALGEIGGKRAISYLFSLLFDTYGNVCRSAFMALKDANLEALLIKELGHEGAHTVKIIEMLGELESQKAVPYLINLLRCDENRFVRAAATRALGQIKDKAAVKHLIDLLDDPDPMIRAEAAESLGKLNSWEAIPTLAYRLNDTYPLVRKEAIRALGLIKANTVVKELIDRLEDYDYEVRGAAAEALGEIGDKASVEYLIHRLREESQWADIPQICGNEMVGFINLAHYNFYVCEEIVRALGKLEGAEIADLLRDQSPSLRLAVIHELGRMGYRGGSLPSEVCALLIERLQDESPWVKAAAAQTLAISGHKGIESYLLPLLHDPIIQVRRAAVDALTKIGSDIAIEMLVELLDSSDPGARRHAAEALGQIGSATATEPLIKRLEDPEAEIRLKAARALGEIGAEEAIQPLRKLLQASSPPVARIALWALWGISRKQGIRILLDGSWVKVR